MKSCVMSDLTPPQTLTHRHHLTPPQVESLTAARKAAAGGAEPADAIRAVNALLTRLDQLRHAPNVMVLTTSNITQAIDLAFVDRADIKAYIGTPTPQARRVCGAVHAQRWM